MSLIKKSRFKATLLSLPIVLMLMIYAATALAGENTSTPSGDPLFEGQILSMTKPLEELTPSGDTRYQDIGDGTVLDKKTNLIWKKTDSYQELKKWINWDMAQDFLKQLNQDQFAGHNDWRLPTRTELESLYEENKSIPWNYYWTENNIHMDPIFGYTSCCFWSSETKKEMAWGFNYIRGKAYLSMKGGPGLSLTVIRPVRNTDAAKAAENTHGSKK
ncbi:MAG: hypothetical protein COV66_09335 [Nitrospinae bacterium CG11_big_fil_rev_8_21_14_0_20_45_15]|nr:MAG: hypothetical protein COV66_09335 [Nitrospinae bacterium CG11_big_fil_rev_8_21_14_0_20_45_15]